MNMFTVSPCKALKLGGGQAAGGLGGGGGSIFSHTPGLGGGGLGGGGLAGGLGNTSLLGKQQQQQTGAGLGLGMGGGMGVGPFLREGEGLKVGSLYSSTIVKCMIHLLCFYSRSGKGTSIVKFEVSRV